MGDRAAVAVYVGFVYANMRRVISNLMRGRGPVGLGYLLAFLLGSLKSFQYRIDGASGQFAVRARS
jgi:hypothetical protein